ncbi:istB-like ATP binding family protein [Mycobacterium kansasii 732]|nr:istB-like ATP binding family protein [Mycobacterium kansasii 732]
MRFYAGPTLLVIDELGYLPLPAEAASALFQVVSQRYLKTSIVITTNRGVGAWGRSSATPPWPPQCSTACCTAPWSSTSTASPTASVTTRPPPKPYAAPPPAPANHYTDRCSQVRNFGEHTWGLSMSAVRIGDPLRPRRGRCRSCAVTHVLLPVTVLLRRAYAAERIWAVVTARATGAGIAGSAPACRYRRRQYGAGCAAQGHGLKRFESALWVWRSRPV